MQHAGAGGECLRRSINSSSAIPASAPTRSQGFFPPMGKIHVKKLTISECERGSAIAGTGAPAPHPFRPAPGILRLVTGNHDFYLCDLPGVSHMLRQRAAGTNIHVLERTEFQAGMPAQVCVFLAVRCGPTLRYTALLGESMGPRTAT